MFKFLFKREEDVIEITPSADRCSIVGVLMRAKTVSDKAYKKALIDEVKEQLFKQYDAPEPNAYALYNQENHTLNAIVEEMIESLDLGGEQ